MKLLVIPGGRSWIAKALAGFPRRFVEWLRVPDHVLDHYVRCDCNGRLLDVRSRDAMSRHACHFLRGPVALHINEYLRLKLGIWK